MILIGITPDVVCVLLFIFWDGKEEDINDVCLAAVARQIYLHSGMGIGHLTIRYGGAQRRGVRPNRFHRGSSMVARSCLQTLEKLGLVEKAPNGGRRVTKAGQRELDLVAATVSN